MSNKEYIVEKMVALELDAILLQNAQAMGKKKEEEKKTEIDWIPLGDILYSRCCTLSYIYYLKEWNSQIKTIETTTDGFWVFLNNPGSRASLPFRAQRGFGTDHMIYCGMPAIHRAATETNNNNAQEFPKKAFLYVKLHILKRAWMESTQSKSTAGSLQRF